MEKLKNFMGDIINEVVYDEELSKYGELMTVKEFIDNVKCGGFIDYDGFGNPVKDGKCSKAVINPSEIHLIPQDATHIMWYNK